MRPRVQPKRGPHEGKGEILDMGAVHEDTYVRLGGAWKFSSRIEHVRYIDGGGFAALLRDVRQMRVGGTRQRSVPESYTLRTEQPTTTETGELNSAEHIHERREDPQWPMRATTNRCRC